MSRANRVLQVCINGKYEWQIRALKEWASWHYIDELLDRQKDENNTNHQQAEIQVVLNGIIRSQTTLVDDIDDEDYEKFKLHNPMNLHLYLQLINQ